MTPGDAALVAALHAESWRTAYRGILDDGYLDHRAQADRLAHWQRRLATPGAHAAGLVAELAHRPVGFAYLIAETSAEPGTRLDNLHVDQDHRNVGVGRLLLEACAREVERRGWPRGLHLLVFEANVDARRFYERHGARATAREMLDTPDGGRYPALRYEWADAVSRLTGRTRSR